MSAPSDQSPQPDPTLAELFAPYRSQAIAEAVGVSGDTVRLWRQGRTSPAVDKIPALAEFLREPIETVVKATLATQKAVA